MTVVTFRDPLFSSPFRLLDDVFRGFGGWSGSRVTGFTPLLNVRENDEEYLVMACARAARPEAGRPAAEEDRDRLGDAEGDRGVSGRTIEGRGIST